MKTALLFPGQGSQYVGMGRALWERFPSVRELFDEACSALGFDVRELCFEGPEDLLNSTRYTQPSVYVVSVSAYRVLQETTPLPFARVAGHSLGEYAALVAAGSLTFGEGLRVVRKRAALMDDAAALAGGGMVAVLGLPREDVEQICAEAADGGVLRPANYNAPNQVVISGEERLLDIAAEKARARGAKTIRLSVSAPFHTPLMASASEKFLNVLESTPFESPDPPWVSNVIASEVYTAEDCRTLLARQVCAPVRWEDSIRTMLAFGVERFIELGPGKVLKGLCRRIARETPCDSVDCPEDLEVLQRLSCPG